MPAPTSPLTDPARLAAIQRLGLLDARADETLDHLTAVARSALRAAVALVAVTDDARHLLKSAAGITISDDSPLAAAPCREVIETGQPLVIPDVRAAGLDRDRHALADLGYPAYVGVPVRSRDGHTVGILCVLDTEARVWDEHDAGVLELVAGAIAAHLDLVATLHQREERYRLAVGIAADGVVTIDGESRILFANAAFERIFGYSRLELLGARLTQVMPEELRPRHAAALARYLETGTRTLAWEAVQLMGRHKTGELIPVEISFAEGSAAGTPFFTGIVRDLRSRRRVRRASHGQRR